MEIIIGLCVIVLFSPQPAVGVPVTQLHELLADPIFISFACILFASTIVLFIATRRRSEPRLLLVLLSSIIGAFTVMSAKSLISIVRSAIETHDSSVFTKYPTPYLLLVVMLASGALQVQYVHYPLYR